MAVADTKVMGKGEYTKTVKVEEKPKSVLSKLLTNSTTIAANKSSQIIFFGNESCGMSSLLETLQEQTSPGPLDAAEKHMNTDGVSVLDSGALSVSNFEGEDLKADVIAQCTVWMMHDPKYRKLLKSRLRSELFENTLVVICLDLSTPWTMIDSLNKWLGCIKTLCEELLAELPVATQDRLRLKLEKYVKQYRKSVEREISNEKFIALATKSVKDSVPVETDETVGLTSSNEDVVLINRAIPIVVVVTKSDTYKALDSRSTQGQLEVVQAYLRRECMPYGTALIYTSTHDTIRPVNILTLYKYMMHRIYRFAFKATAHTDIPEAIFYPSGWDTEEELNDFASKTIGGCLAAPYETLIMRPMDGKAHATEDELVQCPSIGAFLEESVEKHPNLLAEKTERKISVRKLESMQPAAPITQDYPTETPAPAPAAGGEQAGESAALQNFFQGLAAKGRGKAPPPKIGQK